MPVGKKAPPAPKPIPKFIAYLPPTTKWDRPYVGFGATAKSAVANLNDRGHCACHEMNKIIVLQVTKSGKVSISIDMGE